MPAFQPGTIGNPGGRPKSLKDVRSLARKQSMNALHALIGVYTRPDGKIDRSADGKMVVAAAQTVLTWAYGKPPDYDPAREEPETKIDLTGLTIGQRKVLLETLSRVTTVPGSATDDGPDFEPERFAPEPMTLEAEPIEPVITMPETRGQRPAEEDPAVFVSKRATLQANAKKNMAKRRKRKQAKPKV